MKIGFDSKRLFNNPTGLGNYSRTLLKNLADQYPEHQYVLYTTLVNENSETSHFLDNPSYQIRIPNTEFKAYWRAYSVNHQLLAGKVELYHGLSHELPFLIHKTGIASVVTIHDLIYRIHPETYAFFDRKIYDRKSRYACKHSTRIIAISESTKSDIIGHYRIDPDKIDVIYQACHPTYYHLRSKSEADLVTRKLGIPNDYLLSVGSVTQRKNQKSIVEALAWMRRDLEIPLVIVGRGGKYMKEAKSMAHRAGLSDRVFWLDHISNPSVLQPLYQNAKALIYPSLYEGFGLPVAEALLSRTPVITSNTSSLREAGGPMSMYIDPEDPQELAAAIEKLLDDQMLAFKMSETGYLYAHQQFAPDKVTADVVNCYNKALEQNGKAKR